MPNKLKLQTVYVPVENGKYEVGSVYGFECRADKQENRIVLTPQELVLLFAEYKEGPFGLTEFCNHKEIPI